MKLATNYRMWALAIVGLVAVFSAQPTQAQPSASSDANQLSKKYDELIPRNLMRLMHTPEVQNELGLDSKQVDQLEEFFARNDGEWLRSRNYSAEKKAQVVASLEQGLKTWLAKYAIAGQRRRLKEIEYRSQNVRMLLRDDLAKRMKISSPQQAKIAKLARTSEAAQLAFNKGAYSSDGATEAQQNAVVAALKAEGDSIVNIMRPEQMEKLRDVLGEAFDTRNLQRIFPMAPELSDAKEWINSDPVKLKELRGKVVLLHFYAFQCHNCHANFDIYKRWHDELASKGVVVLGVQSPETPTERNPAAVRAAAAERNLDFPILIDLEMDNWKQWGTTMWPTVFVIDQKGYIRHIQMGELQWQGARYDKDVERIVEALLKEGA